MMVMRKRKRTPGLETSGGYPKNSDLVKKEMSKILNRPGRKKNVLKVFEALDYTEQKIDREGLAKLLEGI
jgi:hypothetical protein